MSWPTGFELMGEAEWIWNVYNWLLVPLTLWPIDFEGVAQHTIRIAEGKVKMDRGFWLLLRMFRPLGKRRRQSRSTSTMSSRGGIMGCCASRESSMRWNER